MKEEQLTLQKAADIADRDTSTMRRAIERGNLKATKYGNTWVVIRTDLEAWMKSPSYNDNKRRGETT